LRADEQFTARRERLRGQRRAHLPTVVPLVGHFALIRRLPFRRQIHSVWVPIIAYQAHAPLGADDADCVPLFVLAVVTMGVEIRKAALPMGDAAALVLHEHHGVVLGRDLYLALAANLAGGRQDAGHGDDRFGWTEQAGERGQVVDRQVGKAAAAFL